MLGKLLLISDIKVGSDHTGGARVRMRRRLKGIDYGDKPTYIQCYSDFAGLVGYRWKLSAQRGNKKMLEEGK